MFILSLIMNKFIIPLDTPKSYSSGNFLENFYPNCDVIVVSRGNIIEFRQNTKSFEIIDSYCLFGNISYLIPLKHISDTKSNLLVILNDLRFCILSYSNEGIITVQNGSFKIKNEHCPIKYSIALHAFILQVSSNTLMVTKILPNSLISFPFFYSIPSKSIIDFGFLVSNDSYSRIVVLSDEFDMKTKIQAYETEFQQQILNLKPNISMSLDNDSYLLSVVNESTVIILSTNIAKRIHFFVSSQAQIHTSTILTMNPIRFITKMSDYFYVCVDYQNQVLFMNLSDNGKVIINRIGEIDQPVSFFRIDEKHIISIARAGYSSLIGIQNGKNSLAINIHLLMCSGGPIRRFVGNNPYYVSSVLYKGSIRTIQNSYHISELFRFEIQDIFGLWLIDKDLLLVSKAESSFVIRFSDNLSLDNLEGLITDSRTIFFGFSKLGWIQVTPYCISFEGGRIFTISGAIISASLHEEIICIGTLENDIFIYDHNGDIVFQYKTMFIPSQLSINKRFLAVSGIDSNLVEVIDCDNPENIQYIPTNRSVSLSIVGEFLYILENFDVCHRYLLSELSVQSYFCPGIHNLIYPQIDNSILITGKYPLIFKDDVFYAFPCSFLFGTIRENIIIYYESGYITISEIEFEKMLVRSYDTKDEIVDIVDIDGGENIVVLQQKSDHLSLSVSSHPLISHNSCCAICTTQKQKYISMCTLEISNGILLFVLFEKIIMVYEISHGELLNICNHQLDNTAVYINRFVGNIIVGFSSEIHVYFPEIISLTCAKLKLVSSTPTFGSSSCFSVDDDMIAIGDEIESILLLQYNQEKSLFSEIARNTFSISIYSILLLGSLIYCSDENGNLFILKNNDIQNFCSIELDLVSSINIGEKITTIYNSQRFKAIFLGTESGQLLYISDFLIDQSLVPLIELTEKTIESIGGFSPQTQRIVLHNSFCVTRSKIFDFQIMKYFLELDESIQRSLCSQCGLDYEKAIELLKDTSKQ